MAPERFEEGIVGEDEEDILRSPFDNPDHGIEPGLHNMRVLTGLSMMASGSVDLIMFDGPYFISDGNEGNGQSSFCPGAKITHFGEWDIGGPADIEDEIAECARVLKPTGSMIVWSGFDVLPAIKGIMKKHGIYTKRPIVWAKSTTSPLMSGMGWTSCTEFGLWATRSPRWDVHKFHHVGRSQNWFHANPVRTQRIHSCQKPTELYYYYAKELLDKGDVIVEPYAGSAPMMSVAQQLGCEYYGFEKDDAMVARARQIRNQGFDYGDESK